VNQKKLAQFKGRLAASEIAAGITRLKIGPIEAFDGTPVVDIKSASTRTDE
jgi:tRNA (Thr-GGU) A37 N-methylase